MRTSPSPPALDEATGRGVMYATREALKDQGKNLADHLGAVENKEGLDVPALTRWELDRVNLELEKIMVRAHGAVHLPVRLQTTA